MADKRNPAGEGGVCILLGGEHRPYAPNEFDLQAAALAARFGLPLSTARSSLLMLRGDVL